MLLTLQIKTFIALHMIDILNKILTDILNIIGHQQYDLKN